MFDSLNKGRYSERKKTGIVMDYGSVFHTSNNNNNSNNDDDDNNNNNSYMEIEMDMTSKSLDLYSSLDERMMVPRNGDFPEFDTLEEHSEYLNRQLKLLLGLREDLNFQPKKDIEIKRMMNCMSQLIQERKLESERCENFEQISMRLQKDYERSNEKCLSLQASIEMKNQTIAETLNRLDAKEAAFANERCNLKAEKREMEKKWLQLQNVDQGYRAALRKKEQEYNRLQKYLKDYLCKSNGMHKSIEIVKPLMKGKGKPSSSKLGRNTIEEMIEMIRCAYETTQNELLEENDLLKTSLKELQNDMKKILHDHRAACKMIANRTNVQFQEISDDDFAPTKLLNMPYQLIHEDFQKTMKAKIEKLAAQKELLFMEETKCRQEKSMEQYLQRLEKELVVSKQVIQDQDQLLQLALHQKDKQVDCRDWEKNAELEEDLLIERQALEVQNNNFTMEREMFTKKAAQLDADCVEFQIMKQNPSPSTPMKQVRFSTRMSGSPISLPIPATPDTSALLEKIGVQCPIKRSNTRKEESRFIPMRRFH